MRTKKKRREYVNRHSLAEHSSRCVHVSCYCYECTLPFEGSPASLVHHLTAPSVTHYWPATVNIKYESCFAVPESLEDHRRLLVSEEDSSVFLLIAGTCEARTGHRPLSVVCVRGDAADADTDTRPMYVCVLTVTTPPRYVGGDTGYAKHTWTLPSWDFPADVDMERARCYLNPNDVHGDSKEVHLDTCITKINVDH